MEIKAPTVKALAEVEILSLVEKACKLKAQKDLIDSEIESLKEQILESGALSNSRTRISTPFGYVQYYSKGKKSDVFSDIGKLLMSIVRELLKQGGHVTFIVSGQTREFTMNGGDLVEKAGDPYITVSSTAKATKEV